MKDANIKKLAWYVAEARILLGRGDAEGVEICLAEAAGLIPEALYPNHDEVEKEIDKPHTMGEKRKT